MVQVRLIMSLQLEVELVHDAIVYDVVNEREGTVLEMRQNEAYGLVQLN